MLYGKKIMYHGSLNIIRNRLDEEDLPLNLVHLLPKIHYIIINKKHSIIKDY